MYNIINLFEMNLLITEKKDARRIPQAHRKRSPPPSLLGGNKTLSYGIDGASIVLRRPLTAAARDQWDMRWDIMCYLTLP